MFFGSEEVEQARVEGRAAFQQGDISIDSSPYVPGSRQDKAWRKGWEEALDWVNRPIPTDEELMRRSEARKTNRIIAATIFITLGAVGSLGADAIDETYLRVLGLGCLASGVWYLRNQ